MRAAFAAARETCRREKEGSAVSTQTISKRPLPRGCSSMLVIKLHDTLYYFAEIHQLPPWRKHAHEIKKKKRRMREKRRGGADASRDSDVAFADGERALKIGASRAAELFERETYSGYPRALIRRTVLRVVRDVSATTVRATPISSLFPRYHPTRGKTILALPLDPVCARDLSHGPGSSHPTPRWNSSGIICVDPVCAAKSDVIANAKKKKKIRANKYAFVGGGKSAERHLVYSTSRRKEFFLMRAAIQLLKASELLAVERRNKLLLSLQSSGLIYV